MNAKWYISTLFFLFTLFGAFHEEVSTPNQEIVLEFVDVESNKNAIDITIADIKEKLLNAGVSNININKAKNGSLKISYFSNVDVITIKKVLQENILIVHQDSKNNQKEKFVFDYSLDVYELNKEINSSNLNDSYVLEHQFISDRFITSDYQVLLKSFDDHQTHQQVKTKYRVNKNIFLVKEISSCTKPEVRAGPFYLFS